jgi:hypothetical protein
MLLFASGPETSACIVTQNVLPKFLGTVGDSWNYRTKYQNREDLKNVTCSGCDTELDSCTQPLSSKS